MNWKNLSITVVLFAIATWYVVHVVSNNQALIAQPQKVVGSEQQAPEVVNVYSSRKEQLILEVFDAFTVETGIKVNILTDKAKSLIKRIEVEGRHTNADLFLTSDIGNLVLAKEKLLLRNILSGEIFEQIPTGFYDPDKQWFALSKRVRAIFYAKDRVDPRELSTYLDLADPKWKGRILVRSSSNIYNQSLIAAMINAKGERDATQWMEGLVANFARKPQGGDTDQLRALAAGEGDIAIANSYYYARLAASDNPDDRLVAEKIGIFFPDQQLAGAHVNISGGGVVALASNPENAQKLLVFLAGDKAQRIYANANHEYPIRADIQSSKIVQAWGQPTLDEQNILAFTKYLPLASQLADRVGWR